MFNNKIISIFDYKYRDGISHKVWDGDNICLFFDRFE